MFNIKMCYNKSERNKVDKDLEVVATLSGVMREDTSIIDPVFIVERPLSQLSTCNYLTVDTLHRSYFINKIVSVSSFQTQIECHVDVLSSFKNEIRANTGIVLKQQMRYNLFLDDGTFKVYQNPIIKTKLFPNGFTTKEFVLAISGSVAQPIVDNDEE